MARVDMSTVYVTQEVEGRNFIPAQKFGRLEALLPSNAQIVFSAEPTLRKLESSLAKFSDEDYLLMSGDPLIMGLALHVALTNNRGYAKCLKWDKRERTYYEVVIDRYKKGESVA